MIQREKTKRICPVGHRYYKRSDCPVCPICEQQTKPTEGFLSTLSSPARNALLAQGIDSLIKLAAYTEKEILKLHGLGKSSIPVLKEELAKEGLAFRSY
ncbi:DNA-directed RNA polymerase subunit alpha C-terminal domain-containing protein [Sphingobacterium suaedae]|uniref:DNA-directed RNA polymerase subunit alpha C-terminal domain-containing protein n=1 Tax=Sphingobacterium suaedae TaxID=1686402 RepID=A0ABW5KBP2_9SPHI